MLADTSTRSPKVEMATIKGVDLGGKCAAVLDFCDGIEELQDIFVATGAGHALMALRSCIELLRLLVRGDLKLVAAFGCCGSHGYGDKLSDGTQELLANRCGCWCEDGENIALADAFVGIAMDA